jgi:opacity protein-like surface antigen
MRRKLLTGAVLTTLLALTGAASAQSVAPQDIAVGHGGYGYGGYGYHSSTYEEGVLRGLGDLARSIGQADYMSSLAGINRQESVSRYLDNKEKYAETYFRMQQINRAAREAQRPQPLSPEQYATLAKKQAPDRLSDADYNRALGRLNWPAVLSGKDFAAERAALDRAFAGRTAHDVGVSTAFHGDVRKLTAAMQDKLQAEISSMGTLEFIAAKKFLTGLAYESQQPVVAAGLAVAD